MLLRETLCMLRRAARDTDDFCAGYGLDRACVEGRDGAGADDTEANGFHGWMVPVI
jgi:hypothetical protein